MEDIKAYIERMLFTAVDAVEMTRMGRDEIVHSIMEKYSPELTRLLETYGVVW